MGKTVDPAAEAALHAPRTTRPAMPSPQGRDAQEAVQRIREYSDLVTNLAVMGIQGVRTLNLHPAVAQYKTEMLEYLGTKS